MLTLSKTQQIIVGIALTALVVATRGNHFASISHLPSASLAVLFLAGLYLRPTWVLAALLALYAGLDYAAINFGGVSSFCVTPAYAFLLPAYGTMWLAGRWLAKHYRASFSTLLPLSGSLLAATSLSHLFSSGGFYFFGGRYAEPSIIEFGNRVVQYFPRQLESLAFWIAVVAVVHIAFALAHKQQHSSN